MAISLVQKKNPNTALIPATPVKPETPSAFQKASSTIQQSFTTAKQHIQPIGPWTKAKILDPIGHAASTVYAKTHATSKYLAKVAHEKAQDKEVQKVAAVALGTIVVIGAAAVASQYLPSFFSNSEEGVKPGEENRGSGGNDENIEQTVVEQIFKYTPEAVRNVTQTVVDSLPVDFNNPTVQLVTGIFVAFAGTVLLPCLCTASSLRGLVGRAAAARTTSTTASYSSSKIPPPVTLAQINEKLNDPNIRELITQLPQLGETSELEPILAQLLTGISNANQKDIFQDLFNKCPDDEMLRAGLLGRLLNTAIGKGNWAGVSFVVETANANQLNQPTHKSKFEAFGDNTLATALASAGSDDASFAPAITALVAFSTDDFKINLLKGEEGRVPLLLIMGKVDPKTFAAIVNDIGRSVGKDLKADGLNPQALEIVQKSDGFKLANATLADLNSAIDGNEWEKVNEMLKTPSPALFNTSKNDQMPILKAIGAINLLKKAIVAGSIELQTAIQLLVKNSPSNHLEVALREQSQASTSKSPLAKKATIESSPAPILILRDKLPKNILEVVLVSIQETFNSSGLPKNLSAEVLGLFNASSLTRQASTSKLLTSPNSSGGAKSTYNDLIMAIENDLPLQDLLKMVENFNINSDLLIMNLRTLLSAAIKGKHPDPELIKALFDKCPGNRKKELFASTHLSESLVIQAIDKPDWRILHTVLINRSGNEVFEVNNGTCPLDRIVTKILARQDGKVIEDKTILEVLTIAVQNSPREHKEFLTGTQGQSLLLLLKIILPEATFKVIEDETKKPTSQVQTKKESSANPRQIENVDDGNHGGSSSGDGVVVITGRKDE